MYARRAEVAGRVDGGAFVDVDIPGTLTNPKVGIFEIELNTFGVDWTTSIFYTPSGGNTLDLVVDQVFTNEINYVGFSAASGLTGSMDNFSLSAVPEPSSAIAGLLIVSGLFRRRRN